MDWRCIIIPSVRLLASRVDQTAYGQGTTGVPVHWELISQYGDDAFHPKAPGFVDAFSEEELKGLCELYGLVCMAARAIRAGEVESVSALQKRPEWREVMRRAKELDATFSHS